jgi:carboxypeptidase T
MTGIEVRMKFKLISVLMVILSTLTASLSALASKQVALSAFFVETSPVAQMDQIADQFEVVRKTETGFEVLVPQNKTSQFLNLAPLAKLISLDQSASARAAFAESRFRRDSKYGYHSLSEVSEILKATAGKHSEITELVTYGKSKQGNPLLALRVSRHLKDSKTVPRILLTAATHGDEIITTEVLLSLMDQFLEGAETSTGAAANPRFAKILNELEIVFIPVVNPDGFSEQERYDNNVDPNRSYPYPDAPLAVSTASISAELKLVEKYPLAGSIDFHAYSGLVMFPWGYTRQPLEASSKQKFETLTSKMAATNDYGHGQISTILYVAKGSSVDYFFWKNKTLALGIELGDSKAPYPSEIPRYIEDQKESTWIFLESFLSSNSK